MEEADSKICPNCKREIPSVNFTIHTVHCARNIKVCPVCKEPVPHGELQDHHDKLHKLMPCKQCGESVCGTDLEDHIRDSCGHTIKTCRYCDLELPRHELPAHEGYCGVRTEQCPDCQEWVMIKYRQLHLDSNHGFLRLDDDPVPQPKKVIPKTTINPIRDMLASTSNGARPVNGFRSAVPRRDRPATSGTVATSVFNAAPAGVDLLRDVSSGGRVGNGFGNDAWNGRVPIPSSASEVRGVDNGVSGGGAAGEGRRLPKRTNDQPQLNTAVGGGSKLLKDIPVSRGAVKKRPAPKPPANRKRDLQYYSALQRQQSEEKQLQELNAYNAAHGLPPVLSPAAKLDKLRKMDALHNREREEPHYRDRLQGRVWVEAPCDVSAGQRLGGAQGRGGDAACDVSAGQRLAGVAEPEENVRNSLQNLKPMSPAEFMARFEQLRLGGGGGGGGRPDRFSEIKSSLRELRRGLNEVTAPYNSTNSYNDRATGAGPVRLPCEFCGAAVPADDLVQHQTGCRPDLTQLRPASLSPQPPRRQPRAPPPAPAPAPADPYEQPVIPCEFCTESLPVYLITEHQEECRRRSACNC